MKKPLKKKFTNEEREELEYKIVKAMDDTDDRYNYLTQIHNMVVELPAFESSFNESLYDTLTNDIDDLARAYANYRTGNVLRDDVGNMSLPEPGAPEPAAPESNALKAEFDRRSKALAESMGGEYVAQQAVRLVQKLVDDQIRAVHPGRER